MREILFRGKRKDNGKWIEGYYAKFEQLQNSCIYYVCKGHTLVTDVDPETVCQYTGVKKGGKKLFEKDIIECRGNGHHFQTQIEWDERCGGFLFQDTENSWCGMDALMDGGIYTDFKIIGNIFDNPELKQG